MSWMDWDGAEIKSMLTMFYTQYSDVCDKW